MLHEKYNKVLVVFDNDSEKHRLYSEQIQDFPSCLSTPEIRIAVGSSNSNGNQQRSLVLVAIGADEILSFIMNAIPVSVETVEMILVI